MKTFPGTTTTVTTRATRMTACTIASTGPTKMTYSSPPELKTLTSPLSNRVTMSMSSVEVNVFLTTDGAKETYNRRKLVSTTPKTGTSLSIFLTSFCVVQKRSGGTCLVIQKNRVVFMEPQGAMEQYSTVCDPGMLCQTEYLPLDLNRDVWTNRIRSSTSAHNATHHTI